MTTTTAELNDTSDAVYYLSKGEEVFGPHSADELQRFLDESVVLPADFLWYQGLENWVTIERAFGFAETPALTEAPVAAKPVAAGLPLSEAEPEGAEEEWACDPDAQIARPFADRAMPRVSGALVLAISVHFLLLLGVAWATPNLLKVDIATPVQPPAEQPPLEVAFVPEPPDAPPPPPPDTPPPPDVPPPPPAIPEVPLDVAPPAPVAPPIQNVMPDPMPAPVLTPAPLPMPVAVHPKKVVPPHVVVRAPEEADASPTDYLDAPPPQYPPRALREHKSGTVILLVAIDEGGSPIGVRVQQSSGYQELDEAARSQVADSYRFKAGTARLLRVPIAFQLSR